MTNYIAPVIVDRGSVATRTLGSTATRTLESMGNFRAISFTSNHDNDPVAGKTLKKDVLGVAISPATTLSETVGDGN